MYDAQSAHFTYIKQDFTLWVNYVLEASIEIEGVKKSETELRQLESQPLTDQEELYDVLDASKRQIRVLSLHAGESNSLPLVCDLATVSLDDVDEGVDFEALSYCWGQPDWVASLEVRKSSSAGHIGAHHDIAVNSSLHEALVNLRPATGPARRLWVDAICINQLNKFERSQQVAQMSLIYSCAKRVVVWLGVQDDSNRRHCFSTIMAIRSHMLEEYGRHNPSTPEEASSLWSRAAEREISAGKIVDYTNTWRKCDIDWFRRTWVLQEVANSRDTIVCCGSDVIEWLHFVGIARHILINKRHSPLLQYGLMPALFFDVAGADLSDRRESRAGIESSRRDDILNVLIKAHSLKATDPRDKLFALLQFGRETHDVQNLPASIQPDYNKSVKRVFTDFVRWWIAEHQSVRVLSAVHTLQWRSWQKMYQTDPPRRHPYPSWCLDLEHGGEANWAKATLGLAAATIDGSDTTTTRSYCASAALRPDLDLLSVRAGEDAPPSEHDTLRLRGRRICTIAGEIRRFPYWPLKLAQDHHPGSSPGSSPSATQREILDAFDHIYDPTALHRKWLLDRDDQEVQVGLEDAGERAARFRGLHLTYHYERGFERGSPAVPCYGACVFVGSAVRDGNEGGNDRDEREAQSHSGDGQRWVGLCPHRAQPGDVVVMLHGGPVLYLLRQVATARGGTMSPQYEFVGECLVAGYMHGRAVEEAEAAGEQYEVFDLV